MKKRIRTYVKNNNGMVLIISETQAGNLIGETYNNMSDYNDKKESVSKAKFYVLNRENTIHRVMEYFGFTNNNSKQVHV